MKAAWAGRGPGKGGDSRLQCGVFRDAAADHHRHPFARMGENLLPPKVLAVVIVVAFVAFWASLVFHFKDVEGLSVEDS